MDKIIVIVGPTAVGKTALSIELAKALNGEVVNGDSMQVYKQLDIGTAKVTAEEAQGIPHHVLDICEVEEEFSASDFKEKASQAIKDIIARGKVPIVVGGTGLYVEGLLYDFHYSGEQSNAPLYRQQKEQELTEIGPEQMWQQLKAVDPKAAQTIHPNNTRRVIRALEVTYASGKPFSENDANQKTPVYDAYVIGLNTDRGVLYERINQRVDMMLDKGILTEARMLFDKNFDSSVQSVRGIGYKEWFPMFKGDKTQEECIETLKQNSRRYAKRQLTWFRNRIDGLVWYDLLAKDSIAAVIEDCQKFMK
ncbi:tRNA dimethylallyltransferase [Granulicatella balaenopterae]|uniref:tRNA dimethylallyltransferase n=1 Tax=Granulicatella balaenopterae TaxID=137733 RepID=A0A1H9GR84_9LACT|nr:tRNA (adenosine(37)-N6)-dimethylallyltransferase MiaA [Granulicatella balaenopterae]SEQ52499.1 tRNA dimethylallyltransferase [Granulicatella balaenopterae]